MTTLASLCELIYPVPNPWDTLEERERYEHRDLWKLSRPELLRERDRARLRLTLDDSPPVWILERVRLIEEGLSRAR
jgi:hypothetical protein